MMKVTLVQPLGMLTGRAGQDGLVFYKRGGVA
jgi:hypothetical protein